MNISIELAREIFLQNSSLTAVSQSINEVGLGMSVHLFTGILSA